MGKIPTPCTQKQRRYIIALWHKIKLKDDVETLFKMISKIVRRPIEEFGEAAGDVLIYDYKALNYLSSSEAYKVCQGFINISKQNLERGTNVKINAVSEFSQKCKFCDKMIYWGVASMNERIPIEIIDGVNHWHNCKK